MTNVTVQDGNDEDYVVELKPIVNLKYMYLINPREFGISIALNLFDEEDVILDDIDGLIEERLEGVVALIREEVVDVLKDNGVEVSYC